MPKTLQEETEKYAVHIQYGSIYPLYTTALNT